MAVRIITPPDARWQSAGYAFVGWAERLLWEDATARAELSARGLDDGTIRAAHLGWNPRDWRRPGRPWGLERQVWLPKGWVIPNIGAGVLWGLNIRRPEASIEAARARNAACPGSESRWSEDKYLRVLGSRRILYGLDSLAGASDALICEGEFDALLLRQHVGRVCACVALGGAGRQPVTGPEVARLAGVRRIWFVPDADDAGRQATERLRRISPRVRVLEVPAHDVTDYWRAGGDLVRWTLDRVGPREPRERLAWVEHHLLRLGDTPDLAIPLPPNRFGAH